MTWPLRNGGATYLRNILYWYCTDCTIKWQSAYTATISAQAWTLQLVACRALLYSTTTFYTIRVFFLVVDYFLISISLKFHKDPSFRWRVISLFVTLYNLELSFFSSQIIANFEKINLILLKPHLPFFITKDCVSVCRGTIGKNK